MRYLIRKDKSKRLRFSKSERLGRLTYAVTRVPNLTKERVFLYLSNFMGLQTVYANQFRNLCRYTGNSRAVWRLFHISRSVFKAASYFGWFFGLKRISW